MAVLNPQDNALAARRRRQSSIAVGRPSIRVVRAGQRAIRNASGTAEHIERVFYGIVPGGSDDVQKKLAGKVAGREPPAHLAAVDRDCSAGPTAILAPFGDNFSRIVEQRQAA